MGYGLHSYITPKQPIYDDLAAQKEAVYVKLNNTILGFETPPVIEDGRTLIPLRFLFETMGADVGWYNEHQMAVVQQNDRTVEITINNPIASVNGATATMDVPARLIESKTMVPLRFLSENLGYTVEWDDEANMVIITTE